MENSNAEKSAKLQQLETLKEDFHQVIGDRSDTKVDEMLQDETLHSDVESEKYVKGDHVLVSGIKRKMPALLGDKLDDSDYVEVNFYSKTVEKGWHMLEVMHVVKYTEIERKIGPPIINKISRTRAFLEFPDLKDLSFTESSDTSFDI